MPDYGDFFYDGSTNEIAVMLIFAFIFIWCGIGVIVDKFKTYKEKKQREQDLTETEYVDTKKYWDNAEIPNNWLRKLLDSEDDNVKFWKAVFLYI